jgi:glycosyltransferase involved in cell wall biosynthesis
MTIGQLVHGLLERGHRVQLIRPRQTSTETSHSEGNLEVVPVFGVRLPFYREVRVGLPVGRALTRLWRVTAPDIVHIATEGPLGNSALGSALRLNIPVSSSFHTNFHSYSQHYGAGLLAKPIITHLRRFHNRTACTLVATEEMVTQLQALGFQQLRVLARGVDTHLFDPAHRSQELRQSWGAGPDDPVFLYVGRLAAEKNLQLVMKTYSVICEQSPNARLVLVGDGPARTRLTRQYPQVIYSGMRTGQALATHYASADIFLFPSLTETFGNVTLEAMASGLAVIAFNYAAARRHLEHNRNGLPVPVGDKAAFVQAAQSVVNSPECWRRLGAAARRSAEPFDWEYIYQNFEATLLELATPGVNHV